MADQADRLRQLVRLARAHEPPTQETPTPRQPWGWLGKAAGRGKTPIHPAADQRKSRCKLS